jgi:acyl-CoA reductase-like NAD-dependent aldehyde dehydrogenase
MSYCPADGRILGNANARIQPETPDGVNRAVQAARDAQPHWARTTFTDRRKVLKTLLKYVHEE